MVESGKSCALGGMLGAIAEMKKSDKWGFIIDKNGNVATFMKYKACYFDACKFLGAGVFTLEEQAQAKWMIGALQTGGTLAIDLDMFASNENVKPETYLNTEWFANIDNKAKFLEYDNINAIGLKYPDITKEVIGEHKAAYTPKDNPAFICFVAKADKVPKNFEGKFEVLTVT